MYKKFLQSLILGSGLLFVADASFATKHMVMVSDNVFTPSSFTAIVGDTVQWMFTPGSMEIHTTTSTSVPSGAAPWDHLVNTANPTFEYKITQAGPYNYQCTPHASLGMVASFNAVPIMGVGNIESKPFSVSPNPATNSISFKGNIKSLNVTVCDLNGRNVKSFTATNISEKTFSIQGLTQGMYILNVSADGKLYNEKLVVTE